MTASTRPMSSFCCPLSKMDEGIVFLPDLDSELGAMAAAILLEASPEAHADAERLTLGRRARVDGAVHCRPLPLDACCDRPGVATAPRRNQQCRELAEAVV